MWATFDRDRDRPAKLEARTITNDADRQRKFNRSELIHQIPRDDPAYDALFGRRQDAESINRGVDDHLPLRRARSYGRKRQLLDLLGHAIRVNTVALMLAQRRRQTQAA